MKTKISKKWHRVDNDNTQELHLSNGVRFRVIKQYDWETCEHSKFRGKGEWKVEVLGSPDVEWEWIDTYCPMWFAKENAEYWANRMSNT